MKTSRNTRPSLLSLLALTAGLTAPAFAQASAVVPAALANLHATGGINSPFGQSASSRTQILYNAAEIGISTPVTIQSFQFRIDENTTVQAKGPILLQVEMSTSVLGAATCTGSFAGNRGGDHRIVYTRKPFALLAAAASTPGSFTVPIVLDTPYAYDPAQGNLLIEVDIANQPSSAYPLDATPASPTGYHSNVGAGCNNLVANTTGGGMGGTVPFTVAGGPPSGIGLFLLGYRLFPQPVPIPGNPGCQIYQNFPFLGVVTLNTSGNGNFTVPVPNDPNLRLATIYGQFALLNAAFTNVDSSQTRAVMLGDRFLCTYVGASNNTATSGAVFRNQAPVVKLNW